MTCLLQSEKGENVGKGEKKDPVALDLIFLERESRPSL